MSVRIHVGALLLCGLAAGSTQAAESYDTCDGFIDSLPAIVTSQGTWCLRHDLSTAAAGGPAIYLEANNATLDCNGFKLGGLAAGDATAATGIHAVGHNVTVRNCSVRGFRSGIVAGTGGGGYVVEDNRVDQSTAIGIEVWNDGGSVVRRNLVTRTGGNAAYPNYGIHAFADVLDNTVTGVVAPVDHAAVGIDLRGTGTRARGNRVRGIQATGSGTARGIAAFGTHQSVVDNHIASVPSVAGTGLGGGGASSTFCGHNHVQGFATAIAGCQDAGGNASQP